MGTQGSITVYDEQGKDIANIVTQYDGYDLSDWVGRFVSGKQLTNGISNDYDFNGMGDLAARLIAALKNQRYKSDIGQPVKPGNVYLYDTPYETDYHITLVYQGEGKKPKMTVSTPEWTDNYYDRTVLPPLGEANVRMQGAETFNSYKVAPELSSYTKEELIDSKAGPQGTDTYDEMEYDPIAQDRLSAEECSKCVVDRELSGLGKGSSIGFHTSSRSACPSWCINAQDRLSAEFTVAMDSTKVSGFEISEPQIQEWNMTDDELEEYALKSIKEGYGPDYWVDGGADETTMRITEIKRYHPYEPDFDAETFASDEYRLCEICESTHHENSFRFSDDEEQTMTPKGKVCDGCFGDILYDDFQNADDRDWAKQYLESKGFQPHTIEGSFEDGFGAETFGAEREIHQLITYGGNGEASTYVFENPDDIKDYLYYGLYGFTNLDDEDWYIDDDSAEELNKKNFDKKTKNMSIDEVIEFLHFDDLYYKKTLVDLDKDFIVDGEDGGIEQASFKDLKDGFYRAESFASDEDRRLKAFAKKIENEKKKLVKKAKRSGFYENFGEKEAHKLEDSISDLDYYERQKYQEMIREFENWAYSIDLRDLEHYAETFASETTSTLKSIGYVAGTVGVGYLLFQRFLKDKLDKTMNPDS